MIEYTNNQLVEKILGHDLPGMMRSIHASCEAFDQSLPPQIRKKNGALVDNLRQKTRALYDLSHKLYFFQQDRDQEVVEIDMRQELQCIVGGFREELKAKQLKIAVDNLGVVYGTRLLIKVLLRNLIANIIQHAKAASEILISLKAKKGFNAYTFANRSIEGPGDKEALDYKMNHGLGLKIIYNIVKKHGGEIEVTHKKSGAFFVTFSLPTTKKDIKPFPALFAKMNN